MATTKPTLEKIFDELKGAGLPARVLEGTVELHPEGALLHTMRRHCAANSWGRANSNATKVKYKDCLTRPDVCRECVAGSVTDQYYSYWRSTWEAQTLSAMWKALEVRSTAERTVARFQKGQKVAVGKVAKYRREAAEVTRTRETIKNSQPGSDVITALDDTIDALENALAKVVLAAQGDAHQEKVLAKVRTQLVPANWKGVEPQFDETSMLVGIAPGNTHAPNRELEEVLTTFTVSHTQERRVLVAPRYVYDHVQRSFPGGVRYSTYLTAVEAPDDVALREAAISLWNPSDEGPLADLGAALEAAGMV